MSIILKQSSGSWVTPVDDARLYNIFLDNQVGIVEGITTTHLGANQFKISTGWGICQGRQFTVEEEILNATVATTGTMKGRLLIHIDVTSDTPISFETQAAINLPALIQEDINGNGSIYQIPIITYDVNEISISNIKTIKNQLLPNMTKQEYAGSGTGVVKKADIATAAEYAESADKLDGLHAVAFATAAQGTKADKAMPITGGSFAGDASAVSDNRTTSCIRNIEVRITSPTGELQPTNSIIMVRK